MNRNRIEHLKTGILVTLVFISFIFSGYLWYNTPASETLKPDNDVPPYIFKNPVYSNRERHELVSPSQIALHKGGRAMMVFPDSIPFRNIGNTLQKTEISQLKEVFPNKEAWRTLSRTVGIEFLYSQDTPFDIIDSFFSTSISPDVVKKWRGISRIWFFTHGDKVKVWLIDDRSQRIAEGHVDLTRDSFEKLVALGNKTESLPVIPTSLQGALPWDSSNPGFARILYLPTTTLKLRQLTFAIENISIENMKQWLFRDPDIRPLIPNDYEFFYMYNDQLLNYNKKFNYMTYNDSSSNQEDEERSKQNQLDQIKNFMQRHQGWTGFYLLDEVQKDELYLFRLYKHGYPVYWQNTENVHNIHPDQIQLQTGNTGVSKYIRSMYFLSGKPIKTDEIELPSKEELLKQISKKRVPIFSIQRIYPGYIAKETTINKKKHIVLHPTWVVQHVDGKRVYINSYK